MGEEKGGGQTGWEKGVSWEKGVKRAGKKGLGKRGQTSWEKGAGKKGSNAKSKDLSFYSLDWLGKRGQTQNLKI